MALLAIALTWLYALRTGYRWVCACGVHEPAARLALACIPPTAGLLLAVHIPAAASVLAGGAWVNPVVVAVAYLVLSVAAHVAVASGLPLPSAPHSAGRISIPRLGIWWWPVGIVLGLYGVFLLDALTRYPTGADALTYHLPTAVRWMQHRSLDLIAGSVQTALPENGMIVPFLLAFARLEGAMSVVHVPKAVLLALLIYALARAIGVRRQGAIGGACIALSIPIVVFQSFSAYVDLYAADAWLSALLAVVWYSRTPERNQRMGLLVLSGLSAGVALGSKTNHLLLVSLLAGVVALAEWIRPHRNPSEAPQPIRRVAIFGLAALVCSAFWFVRGTIQAGNPVYPLSLSIAGHRLMTGFAPGDVYPHRPLALKWQRWWDYPWREPKIGGTGYLYGVDNGLGAAFAAFVPPGIAAAGLLCVRRHRRGRAFQWSRVFLLLVLASPLVLVMLLGEVARFVLPLILLGAPLAALLLDRLAASYPRAAPALLSVALSVTAAIAVLVPVHALAGRWRDGAWDRSTCYQLPPIVDFLPPGSRILNLSACATNYPLLGRAFTNRVIGPPFRPGHGSDRRVPSTMLRAHVIDYVFIDEPWPDESFVDVPVEVVYEGRPEPAAPTSPLVRLYRILPNDDRRTASSPMLRDDSF